MGTFTGDQDGSGWKESFGPTLLLKQDHPEPVAKASLDGDFGKLGLVE